MSLSDNRRVARLYVGFIIRSTHVFDETLAYRRGGKTSKQATTNEKTKLALMFATHKTQWFLLRVCMRARAHIHDSPSLFPCAPLHFFCIDESQSFHFVYAVAVAALSRENKCFHTSFFQHLSSTSLNGDQRLIENARFVSNTPHPILLMKIELARLHIGIHTSKGRARETCRSLMIGACVNIIHQISQAANEQWRRRTNEFSHEMQTWFSSRMPVDLDSYMHYQVWKALVAVSLLL